MALFRKKSTTGVAQTPDPHEASFLERMRQSDATLMIVVGPEDGSSVCGDWVGAVVSVPGNDPDWPSLEEAIEDGVFHAHCRHGLSPYVGEDQVEAQFCTQLAVVAMQSRRASAHPSALHLTTTRQHEFAKLYHLAQQADSANAIETAYVKCAAALEMLKEENIFGAEQAQVEEVLKARLRAIDQHENLS